MKRQLVVLTVLTLVFLVSCGKLETICKSPYIEYKRGECCLDGNGNGICDKDDNTESIKKTTADNPEPVNGKYDITNNAEVFGTVPTAIYNLYPGMEISLVDYHITNNENEDMRIIITSEIQGYSLPQRSVETIPAHSTKTISHTPLLPAYVVIHEITTANFHSVITLADDESVIIDEGTMPIKLYPRDTMIWSLNEGGESVDLSEFIVAWVTPHVPEIDGLIARAARRHLYGTMPGYVCSECGNDMQEWNFNTGLQVKAIYESLREDYNIRYVNTPIAYGSGGDAVQRVRLPADSIAYGSGNCIDGTLVFASALESLGINTYILLMPEHSLVCWDIAPEGGTTTCLETTMVGNAPFEDAWEEGEREQQEQVNNLRTGVSMLISVNEMRERGIYPIE